ncbi:Pimeloyl-ACP methyl ester carboxylesterase [Dethiosulfatibacter aminovorans DSM 17477]|uniref:Pimeloyl-ACP methyl ester carboxylesterase n=1 Tax=Dethiosulfatibacter aminovorans DSM 17477 TaxID=1121476 RepID=A0A1M6I480_9FIRM|nr:alpha/beta hydrolase [Dethiosulfatibacter aminovorans]SHJ29229.1 Pimeloyl-ACP methyl ester carboxylesterase [Dethiosulfatibacter aminovorans DSM 17477]
MKNSVYKSNEGKMAILEYYRNIQENINFDYSEKFVDTSFGKTYLLEAGDEKKPTILLFHGSCSNSAMWYGDMGPLSENFHVVSIDILGEPGNSDENRLDIKSDNHALWIDEIVESLGVDKVILAGNSLGGWMALKYATSFPSKVDKIVLIAPSGLVPARLSFVLKSIFYAMQGERGFRKLGELITGMDELPEEVLKFNMLIANHFKPVVGGLPVFSDEDLSKLIMPVMLIYGENDVTADVRKAAERLENHLLNPNIMIIKNNSHVVYNIVEKIIDFLRMDK